ncbi:unnamed protein product [Chondrus crispus]|uniref:Raptor N-terminal CASPase-like domain-containing protein n=1 Tax=Chondrus crispus TaxID=2769 RepID=R7QN17_CHOCR|nr:unnamed protein product [Chondrus crispus]CDF38876.1 unnamed protein product [Chondrus crispus]|eukprot:XP_005718781.1 unnamed protein product [Chondrus crispus]
MYTTHFVLMVCLNVGVDPPGARRPTPSAKLECWIDPTAHNQNGTAVKTVITQLKKQYAQWQPHHKKFKLADDPVAKDVRSACGTLRKQAKDDRVLFHYNGHGVPDPTSQGELWVFNNNFTQYIPFPLDTLFKHLGSPAILVFDCNSAERIVDQYKQYRDDNRSASRHSPPFLSHQSDIMLAACSDGERLPLTPQLPADLFTSCLTTPIKTILHWFVRQTLVAGITDDMVDRIPGSLSDRSSPLGELNWIFLSVTDAIAWNLLPREEFLRLYRQDMFLSSLLRHYLLAERVMRSFGCHTVSSPKIPEAFDHNLWKAFDVAVEKLFSQLPRLIAEEEAKEAAAFSTSQHSTATTHAQPSGTTPHANGLPPSRPGRPSGRSSAAMLSSPHHHRHHHHQRHRHNRHRSSPHGNLHRPLGTPFVNDMGSSGSLESMHSSYRGSYQPSTFFADQLKAFDVWLDMGPEHRGPPEQLPIMLQVLLSDELREIALPLLSRYVQTGPMAVDYFLSVGIFPYIIRLTESRTKHQRQELVFIWSKILALDHSCTEDLIEIEGDSFFMDFLKVDESQQEPKPVYLAVAMFVLSVIARKDPNRCRFLQSTDACIPYLRHSNSTVRRWACLSIMTVIRVAPYQMQSQFLSRDALLEPVEQCAMNDASPDVRASATELLSTLMGQILRHNSPYYFDDRGASSQGSKTDYFLNPVKTDMTPIHMSNSTPAVDLPLIGVEGRRNGSRTKTAAEVVMENTIHTPLVQTEFLSAPVPPYTACERNALLLLGRKIADIARRDSCVVVRREVSTAIAQAVRSQIDRFLCAAYVTDVLGTNEAWEEFRSDDEQRCSAVYRQLWMTLSELANDPHPIVAALARRSYDLISELLLERAGPLRRTDSSSQSQDDILGADHIFSPSSCRNSNFLTSASSLQGGRSGIERTPSAAVGECPGGSSSARSSSASPRIGLQGESNTGQESRIPLVNGTFKEGSTPPLVGGSQGRISQSPSIRACPRGMRRSFPQRPFDVQGGSVHVRSTSGSFDLNASSRLPLMTAMPRVNSASLIPPTSLRRRLPTVASTQDFASSRFERGTSETEERPRSLPTSVPHIAIAVGRFFRQFTEPIQRPGGEPTSNLPHSFGSNASSTGGKEDGKGTSSSSHSPPGVPRRSISYQVLNAETALNSSTEIPIAASGRPSFFASATHEGSSESLPKLVKIPEGYDRLYLSQGGDAALSLLEWSSASVARLEFDATQIDNSQQKESVPRYAALWDKFLKSSGNIPSEGLRAFALLGEGQNGMGGGSCGQENGNGQGYQFQEISSHVMTISGGAVTSIAFLPRDVGIGEEQLIASGDNQGFVGIYDIQNGRLHAKMAVPHPPGIPPVGVSAVLCLNRPSPAAMDSYPSFGNSRSALILAGAYDGRVAIFKSEPHGPKYRVMSTFQSSGQSYWSKVGTIREPEKKPKRHDVMGGTYHSSDSMESLDSYDMTFAKTVKDSGNGLVLAFDSESSYLVAGGCDGEAVRVWDLAREYCIWEGAGVATGTWPTAVTMWGRINPKVFVTGSSDGTISIIDIRSGPAFAGPPVQLTHFGEQKHPIISLGTYSPFSGSPCETVVSADIGGEIAFWDSRLSRNSPAPLAMETPPSLSHIKAHRNNLTCMSVHPAGTLIASGSTARCVKIFGPNRAMLKMMSAHDRDSGHDLTGDDPLVPPVTCLSFQPDSNMLAIGSLESTVMVYGQPDTFPGVYAQEDEIQQAKRAVLSEYGN